jgi:hypothetical protein
MHRSKKLYVHAIMKNEALLDAEMEWGRMTPSPNEIVRKKAVRNVAAKGGNEFAAICRNGAWKIAALCRLMTPAVAAICRIRGLISSRFNFHLLPTTVFRHRVMLSGDDRNGTTKTRRQGVSQRPRTAL